MEGANTRVFENNDTPKAILLERLSHSIEEFDKFATRIYRALCPRTSTSSNTLQPPKEGVIKINADTAVFEDGWIGLGVVVRDHGGNVKFTATRSVRITWDPQVADARALAMACRLGKRYGVHHCVLESDCEGLIHRFTRGALFLADLDIVLDEIFYACSSFISIAWSHVRRDGNFVAHHLAELVPFGTEQIWKNHCPSKRTIKIALFDIKFAFIGYEGNFINCPSVALVAPLY
ncbi:uncharacterized protein LOC109135379 [Beta vulgaris subsp. vulgaris]|uniref:uncharacterized protein LOC109135379 n=1 Tax=Beta vulgaris subsp. vulgaris TaxID=3555 RepID=UPI000901F0C8|nr:uncharacterized protein LOC109135379 [Beta vulgaris subsp. vulgaris]